jgi:hypothetical protein
VQAGRPSDLPVLARVRFLAMDDRPHWLQIEAEWATPRVVAVPPADPGAGLGAEVAVYGRETDDDPMGVAVRGPNATADALLGFLAAGAFGQARRVGGRFAEDAERLFREKRRDPSSAAVAGYFLLQADLDRLHDWTENLASWFPWLPDGAVIRAWHLLHLGGDARAAAARERLVEAARRGIPLFTRGLRLLVDGLRLFADRDPADGPVSDALAAVRPYAEAADWSATTTLFHGPSPDRPGRAAA